ncbi:MAG: rod shape-determining protein RodA [bacterium]
MFDRRLLSNFDWTLLLLTLTIGLMGVASIYSASKGYPDTQQYWLKQLYWMGLGCGAGFLVLLVDFRSIGQWSYPFHIAVVISLVVLLYVGSRYSSVERWFLVGPVAIQPSEFAKISTIMALAYYLRDSRRVGDLGLREIILPGLIMAVPFFLIVNQPDLGTALLLPALFVLIILMAGLRTRLWVYMVLLFVLSIGLLVASFSLGYYQVEPSFIKKLQRQGYPQQMVGRLEELKDQRYYLPGELRDALATEPLLFENQALMKRVEEASFHPLISFLLRPYQRRRLITFINPDRDPLGSGYHVIQSRVAIGSGGFAGKGYGKSTQGSLNFLPARHTDFIFAIFAEEWGFLGAVGLMSLYGLLIVRGYSIIFQTHDRFSAFVAVGITSIFTLQGLINVGMAVGLLPVVGVPLPLFSYGGSSMVTTLIGIAILLNIRMRRFLYV